MRPPAALPALSLAWTHQEVQQEWKDHDEATNDGPEAELLEKGKERPEGIEFSSTMGMGIPFMAFSPVCWLISDVNRG
mgnify:CR=1 FL=1